MTVDMGGSLNELELRLGRLEQMGMQAAMHPTEVYLDNDTGLTVIDDRLDWSVAAGWESYTTISPIISDEADPAYPGGEASSDFPRPEADLLGSVCLLSGMVRRQAGATVLAQNIRHNVPLFGLPLDWRPYGNVLLPCLMGDGDPYAGTAVGMAWVEVRPELSPAPSRPSGWVYFVTGTIALNPGTGWISLHGIFPCQSVAGDDVAPTAPTSPSGPSGPSGPTSPSGPSGPTVDPSGPSGPTSPTGPTGPTGPTIGPSWDEAPTTMTWDSVPPTVTWDSYPDPPP